MILALNLNASLDKIYTVDKLIYGGVIRTGKVQNTAGGKGIHVANVCKALQEDCVVTGFLGGNTGKYLADELTKKEIKHDFVQINSETRTCINIATSDGKQTEVLEQGPSISEAEANAFILKYEDMIKSADIVVASGSLPVNLPIEFYGKLGQIAIAQGKKFILDTSGKTLQESLCYKPFMIKPNKDEIEALTGKTIESIQDAVCEIKKFRKQGISMPIISLGKEGSVIGYGDKIYHAVPPRYKAVNAVGSGDAFVAGIAIGLNKNYDIEDVIKLGSACGTANVLETESGYVSPENVDKIFKLVKVNTIA